MKRRICLKLGDLILMAGVFFFALFLFLIPFLSKDANSAEILIVQTGEVRVISLNTDATYQITSDEITLTVCVSGGKVSVTDTNCRDGICKNTPAVSRAGQSIVCAPAGIVIRVLGEEVQVDGVSR